LPSTTDCQPGGPQIEYIGTANVSDGWIYSYGQAWYDANIYPATGLVNRPHLMSFNTTNGEYLANPEELL